MIRSIEFISEMTVDIASCACSSSGSLLERIFTYPMIVPMEFLNSWAIPPDISPSMARRFLSSDCSRSIFISVRSVKTRIIPVCFPSLSLRGDIERPTHIFNPDFLWSSTSCRDRGLPDIRKSYRRRQRVLSGPKASAHDKPRTSSLSLFLFLQFINQGAEGVDYKFHLFLFNRGVFGRRPFCKPLSGDE